MCITIPVGTMCKARIKLAGVLAMILYHMLFIIVILPSSISRSRTRLSLWIDEKQIASFFGKSSFLRIAIGKNIIKHPLFLNMPKPETNNARYISSSILKEKYTSSVSSINKFLVRFQFPDENDSFHCLTGKHVCFNDIAASRHQNISSLPLGFLV